MAFQFLIYLNPVVIAASMLLGLNALLPLLTPIVDVWCAIYESTNHLTDFWYAKCGFLRKKYIFNDVNYRVKRKAENCFTILCLNESQNSVLKENNSLNIRRLLQRQPFSLPSQVSAHLTRYFTMVAKKQTKNVRYFACVQLMQFPGV